MLGYFLSFWFAGQTEVFLCHRLTFFFLVPQTKPLEEIEEEFFIPFTLFLWQYLVFEEPADADRGIHKCHFDFVKAEKAKCKEGHVATGWLTAGLDWFRG